jgi:hypothetical protein
MTQRLLPLLGATLIVGTALAVCTAASTQVASPAQVKVERIEFKAPFPKSIDLAPGDSIVFFAHFKGDPGLYDPAISGPFAKTTDKKTGDVLKTETGVKRLDANDIQVRRFTAERAGEAQLAVIDFNGKNVATIQVTVTAPAPAKVSLPAALGKNQFNVDGNTLPAKITVRVGEHLEFLRRVPFVGTNVRTDLKPAQTSVLQQVFTRHVNPAGWKMVGEYTANQAGTVEVVITHTVPGPNHTPTIKTVEVVVTN